MNDPATLDNGALLWLDDVGLEHLPQVGAKLARLGALRSRGSRVPDGFVLSVAAFDAFLPAIGRAELERILNRAMPNPEAGAAIAQEARDLIQRQAFPDWMEERLGRAYSELCERCGLGPALSTAVRSSGVSEDGDGASFAGQYDTYLGIRSAQSVLEHIRKCWASQYTARAVDYRRRRGMALGVQGIAVGVLQLVNARSAGVAFTINPLNGDRRRVVVESNWGFGESVVAGLTTPDHWLLDKATGEVLEERIGAKQVWSVFDEVQGRVVECEATADRATLPSLSPEEVRHVARLAVEIESREGRPQDVEWAVSADISFPDGLFLLQHRPETVWGGRPAPEPEPEPDMSEPYDPAQYALRKVFKIPVRRA
ncbi:MAG: PEP/pyruvate-binding domain-containing protein [Chloroflexota bacterium]